MDEVVIRNAVAEDAAELSRIYEFYVRRTAITFEDDAPDERLFSERMKNIMRFYPYFVAEIGGKVVGYAYASQFKNRSAYDWSVETTVYVAPGCGRHGVGTLLYAALEQALKAQGIKNMYACIAVTEEEDEYLTNVSYEFHKKQGFELIGTFKNCGNKFGRWYTMIWMQKFIGSHPKDPARPLPYSKCK